MVYLKEFCEKLFLKKKAADDKKACNITQHAKCYQNYCLASGERNQKYKELKKREETMDGE